MRGEGTARHGTHLQEHHPDLLGVSPLVKGNKSERHDAVCLWELVGPENKESTGRCRVLHLPTVFIAGVHIGVVTMPACVFSDMTLPIGRVSSVATVHDTPVQTDAGVLRVRTPPLNDQATATPATAVPGLLSASVRCKLASATPWCESLCACLP